MHVLYFHQHFSTPTGSAGTRSYEMARALVRSGCSVTMVCGSYAQGNTGLDSDFIDGVRKGSVDGIDVFEFNLAYSNDMGFLGRTQVFLSFAVGSVRLALREDCDLVFATSTPLTAGVPGVVARWLRGKPFVFEVRDLWPELPRAMGVIKNPVVLWMMEVLEWISYKSANRLIGLSPGIVEGIYSRGGPSLDVAMVPNGCDIQLFQGLAKRWRPLGVEDDELLAIFTGTHGNANGLNSALDAAEELKRRGNDRIKIALVGEGQEKPALKERAAREELKNVIFVDPLPKNQLVGLMAGADLGLQLLRNVPAFYYGTSPNKFFDYVSAGLPVLTNYPGWLAELIEEHDFGYAVAPDDSVAFADALESAESDRVGLAIKGKNALSLALAKFSRQKLSTEWVDWVTGAVGGCKTL